MAMFEPQRITFRWPTLRVIPSDVNGITDYLFRGRGLRGTHRLGGVAPPPPQVSVRLISHRPLLGAFLVVAGDVSRAKQEPGE
ncbi:MAG TPA: hypothetical protein VMT78_00380 [Terriglobia bacterium]|nr:hypothetical protein [Terriglobia bacterium]